MKTYFLVYRGDPKNQLDVLRRLDKIEYARISEGLHCISFGPHLSELVVLNGLRSEGTDAFLVKASHQVFPRPPAKVQAEIDRMIAEGEGETECYIMT
jgi:hypothetical protein